MEFKQIQELVKQINKSHVTELHFEQDDFKITIKKEAKERKDASAQVVSAVPPVMPYPTQPVPPAPTPSQAPAQQPAPQEPEAAKKETEKDNRLTIKAPMIGTFYRSASPDKPAFVNVGDKISSGQNVCIIEAMKLFNEVESEISGKIVEILVEDASPVEFDQPLFVVEP